MKDDLGVWRSISSNEAAHSKPFRKAYMRLAEEAMDQRLEGAGSSAAHARTARRGPAAGVHFRRGITSWPSAPSLSPRLGARGAHGRH